ncbi:MAG: hypothetical protein RIC29_10525 [Rhodospirillaceae bacterium]
MAYEKQACIALLIAFSIKDYHYFSSWTFWFAPSLPFVRERCISVASLPNTQPPYGNADWKAGIRCSCEV